MQGKQAVDESPSNRFAAVHSVLILSVRAGFLQMDLMSSKLGEEGA